MFTKSFFRLFPPPKFLNEPYAGIDISDTAVHCVQFVRGHGRAGKNGGLVIAKYGMKPLEQGIVEGGFVKEKEKLTAVIATLTKELGLDRVRASLPEEEMYIFKAQVPMTDRKTMAQNIEFKLEENVPLSPANAIFYFDVIPGTEQVSAGLVSVSVSVAPRKVVDTYLEVLTNAGLTVISFEMQPRALARALVPKKMLSNVSAKNGRESVLIVQIFARKIGLYMMYDGIPCFTSTIARGEDLAANVAEQAKKIGDYWAERGEGKKEISRIIVSGSDSLSADMTERIAPVAGISVETANVWGNAFSAEEYVSPINATEALDYDIAAGLALPVS